MGELGGDARMLGCSGCEIESRCGDGSSSLEGSGGEGNSGSGIRGG